METNKELIKQIEQMLKEAEKTREDTTDTRQDYYYTGYMDALLAVLKLVKEREE